LNIKNYFLLVKKIIEKLKTNIIKKTKLKYTLNIFEIYFFLKKTT